MDGRGRQPLGGGSRQPVDQIDRKGAAKTINWVTTTLALYNLLTERNRGPLLRVLAPKLGRSAAIRAKFAMATPRERAINQYLSIIITYS
jgi:hypothetical protein